jgi:hypothetical protein
MKELNQYPNGFDKYLNALMRLLRVDYKDVSVNRGKEAVTFFYSDTEGDHQVSIYNGYMQKCFDGTVIPREIEYLLIEGGELDN